MSARTVITTGLSAVGALAMVLAAGWVLEQAPDVHTAQDGFTTTGETGQVVQTEDLVVRVDGVRAPVELASRADLVSEEAVLHPTPGDWVVVDLTASARTAPVLLNWVRLDVDGIRYAPAERRAMDGLERDKLAPGVATRGWLAFEVPAGTLDSADTARLMLASTPDLRLAGMADLEVPLSAAEPTDRLVLEPAELTSPQTLTEASKAGEARP